MIERGFAEPDRARAATLYWSAFGGKLGKLLGPDPRALAFLERVLDPDYALVCRGDDGQLIGLAGFKTAKGALVGGGLRDLAAVFGWVGALWRGILLSLLERDTAPGVLLMDGICVSPDARSGGVGTKLLRAILVEARRRDLTEVRLDVIDTNPRAKSLYAREGFKVTASSDIGPLKYLFGFRRSETMIRTLRDCRTAAN